MKFRSGVPGAPKGPVTVKNVTSKGGTISWQAPDDDGGRLLTGSLSFFTPPGS